MMPGCEEQILGNVKAEREEALEHLPALWQSSVVAIRNREMLDQ